MTRKSIVKAVTAVEFDNPRVNAEAMLTLVQAGRLAGLSPDVFLSAMTARGIRPIAFSPRGNRYVTRSVVNAFCAELIRMQTEQRSALGDAAHAPPRGTSGISERGGELGPDLTLS